MLSGRILIAGFSFDMLRPPVRIKKSHSMLGLQMLLSDIHTLIFRGIAMCMSSVLRMENQQIS